jgi:hypothetical protein
MIPKGKIRQVLNELQQILGVKTDVNVYTYIRGDREPKLSEAMEIENLFRKYGIEVEWGCQKEEDERFQADITRIGN